MSQFYENIEIQKLAKALVNKMGSISAVHKASDLARDTLKKAHSGSEIAVPSARELVELGKAELTNAELLECTRLQRPIYRPEPFPDNLARGPDYDPEQIPSANELPVIACELWGRKLNSPFGASASCLTSNSQWISLWAKSGCDILTYKTVRTIQTQAHHLSTNLGWVISPPTIMRPVDYEDFPQVVYATTAWDQLTAHQRYLLVNCFGMPSEEPTEWQRDVRVAVKELGQGKILVISVVGSVPEDQQKLDVDGEMLVQDFRRCVQYAIDISDHSPAAIELNLSCPHTIGDEGIVYLKPGLAGKIVRECRSAITESGKNIRLLAKIGFISANSSLDTEALACLCDQTLEHLDGFSAINTIPVQVNRKPEKGGREIPFFDFLGRFQKAGISGPLIQRCALQTIEALREQYEKAGFAEDERVIFGMGGVTDPEDVSRFLNAGATVVQASTVLLHNLRFPLQVRQHLSTIKAQTQKVPADLQAEFCKWLADPKRREEFMNSK